MNHIIRSKIGRDLDSPIIEVFKKFLKQWTGVFWDVSYEPEREPLILCPDVKVDKANNLVEAAKIILEQSKGKVKDLAQEEMKEAQAGAIIFRHRRMPRLVDEALPCRGPTSSGASP